MEMSTTTPPAVPRVSRSSVGAIFIAVLTITFAALYALQWIVAITFLTQLDSDVPAGVVEIDPTFGEVALAVTRKVLLPLASITLCVAALRYGAAGDRRKAWIAAIAGAVVAASVFL